MAKPVRKESSAKRPRSVPRRRRIQGPAPEREPAANSDERSVASEIVAVLLLAFGVFLLLSLISFLERRTAGFAAVSNSATVKVPGAGNFMGLVGEQFASVLFSLLGYCSFVTVVWAFLVAKSVWQGWWPGSTRKLLALCGTVFSSFILAAAFSVIASVMFGIAGGGRVGHFVSKGLITYVNSAGTLLLGIVVVFLTFTSSTGVSISSVFSLSKKWLGSLYGAAVGGGAVSGRVLGSVSSRGISRLRSSRIREDTTTHEEESDAEEPGFVLGSVRGKKDLVEEMNTRTIRDDEEPTRDLRDDEFDEEDEGDYDEDEVEYIIDEQHPEIVINRQLRSESAKKSKKEAHSLPPSKQKRKRVSEYQLPSSVLLVKGEQVDRKGPSDKELLANSKRLELTLQNFRIGGRVVEVHPGPVVTLYQFEPAAGVKVQRIITLADDLALSLKVASIRVYAPVPGRGTVGIEVPRDDREIVRLRDLIDAPDFMSPQHALPLALGKDTFGDPFISDLARMPHLLIAGATGTGKSVCINSLLLSLLYRHSPDDLRLIMIDPKMLELSVYEDIPHLKAPVVTMAKRARGVLWWAVEEMDRRYALMKESGVRNLASYNLFVSQGGAGKKRRPVAGGVIELEETAVVSTSTALPALDRELHGGSKEGEGAGKTEGVSEAAESHQEPLPRIVIVVDELADLMLTVGREIEELLTRLAQKARAAGIHLILATQRPSVDVITGLIKANFPSRISFKVASRIDARTVLDNSGSERLLGQGDMLFLSPGAEVPKRLHSPFVSDQEVHDVVEWVRSQGEPDYDPRIAAMIERIEAMEPSNSSFAGEEEEYDPLYDQAYNLVVEKGMASTSMVQRVFRIGYNRAARILETMEREGVVGPADGAKPRQVLIPNRNLE